MYPRVTLITWSRQMQVAVVQRGADRNQPKIMPNTTIQKKISTARTLKSVEYNFLNVSCNKNI